MVSFFTRLLARMILAEVVTYKLESVTLADWGLKHVTH